MLFRSRHIVSAVALTIAIGTAGILAAERATFILTNGERLSGEVVFHTEARTNIREDKNEFNVKVSTGIETPIPFGQVVAIDFAGGRPRPEEISALPAHGHLLTLRDGNTRQGRLIDFVGGTTVKWEEINGQRSDVPMTDVRRIFLQVNRVREVYRIPEGAVPSSTADTSGSSSGAEITAAARRRGATVTAVTVSGAVPWTDTGITVRAGDRLQFDVDGEVYVTSTTATGAGGTGAPGSRFPIRTRPIGVLIGKVATTGRPFEIGTNTGLIQMSAPGRLFLGINDDRFEDNSGSFTVNVIR